MPTLERALAIACEAHKGQTDKVGEPYVLHVLRVVLAVEGDDPRIVAALHDVVEKSPEWTLERIAVESFPPEIVEAVDALTRRPHESEEAYLARATADPLARAVKRADLADNLAQMHRKAPGDRDAGREAEYRATLARLGAAA
jgi:(p)ppGpp synthase/HD superfamily hydrolase